MIVLFQIRMQKSWKKKNPFFSGILKICTEKTLFQIFKNRVGRERATQAFFFALQGLNIPEKHELFIIYDKTLIYWILHIWKRQYFLYFSLYWLNKHKTKTFLYWHAVLIHVINIRKDYTWLCSTKWSWSLQIPFWITGQVKLCI